MNLLIIVVELIKLKDEHLINYDNNILKIIDINKNINIEKNIHNCEYDF